MLDGFADIMEEDVKEKNLAETVDLNNLITNLNLYTNDKETLTIFYTNILCDENVVYIMTRISQNQVFMKHFPEFYATNVDGESVINCQQNSAYHKYGVFKHILYTLEYVGKDNSKLNTTDIKILKWTMFLHDIGKPSVKVINEDGNDSFGGHEEASVLIAQEILERFSFTEHEKKTILTLIKYHDKYLNGGELTYDNLKFLAEELENNRELFNLLIEVKISDNKAKSIEVNKTFQIAVKKYYDFADEYFEGKGKKEETGKGYIIETTAAAIIEDVIDIENSKKIENPDILDTSNQITKPDITNENFESLYKGLVSNNGFSYFYQPIVDLDRKEIFGYEIIAELNLGNNINLENILKKSKDFKKYDRVNQLVFINSLDTFEKIKFSNKTLGFVNIDLESYDKYVNKGRIFDTLDDRNIVIAFYNYSKYNNTKLNIIVSDLRTKGAFVMLNNYDDNNLHISNLNIINPDYIKYYLPKDKISELIKKSIKELLTYCISSETKLVLAGIDKKEDLDIAIECGADMVQGLYFGQPSENINFETIVAEKLKYESVDDESII